MAAIDHQQPLRRRRESDIAAGTRQHRYAVGQLFRRYRYGRGRALCRRPDLRSRHEGEREARGATEERAEKVAPIVDHHEDVLHVATQRARSRAAL
jgi:hypothetical protein